MKTKIFLLFLVLSAGLQAQQPEEKILWSENLLTWEDFKSAPPPGHAFHASANTGLSYSWSAKILGEEVELVYTVNSYFYPQFSWVSKKNDLLLAHEQLHFDISELHARKLRMALDQFDPAKYKGLKTPLAEIYEKIEGERTSMQEQYDRETRHSENKEAQQLWEKKIALELQKLKKFKAKE
ncbi:MAG: DUF922 domain-containing protein [Salinimicrobium sp.]